MKTKNDTIDYPRHWWFTCSAFTCYIETDSDDVIDVNSSGVARNFVGMLAKKFARKVQKKFGGVMINEYDKDGRLI